MARCDGGQWLYMKKTKVLAGFIMNGKAGGVDKYLLSFLEQTYGESVQIDFLTNHIDTDLKKKLSAYGSNLYQVATLKQAKLQYKQICLISIRKEDNNEQHISTCRGSGGRDGGFQILCL